MNTTWYPIACCSCERQALTRLGVKPQEILDVQASRLGLFRPPRKGEWYLSGAVPEAYIATDDLSEAYHIVSVCVTEKIVTRRALRTIA